MTAYLITLIVLLAILFIPSGIAYRKKKKNKIPILVLNIVDLLFFVSMFIRDSLVLALIVSIIWLGILFWSLMHENKAA